MLDRRDADRRCEGGPWIEESIDTLMRIRLTSRSRPSGCACVAEGTVRITAGGGWGEDTECSGPSCND